MKHIETRLSEERFVTSDPHKMLNKYLARRVLKTWTEDYIDKDTGEKHTIERSSVLLEKGTYIDADMLSQINFWIAEGSITEVEVSTQKRMSFEYTNTALHPYKCSVKIDDRKRTFLLYATSVSNAIEIVKDYVELHNTGGFWIIEVKELDSFVVIVDKLMKQAMNSAEESSEIDPDDIDTFLNQVSLEMEETEEDADKTKLKFYQINSRVVYTDKDGCEDERNTLFVVNTYTCTRANLLIEKWLRDRQEERYLKSLEDPDNHFERHEIHSFVEESKIIPIGEFIPTEFSLAYQQTEAAEA